jgi:hypothetical protein
MTEPVLVTRARPVKYGTGDANNITVFTGMKYVEFMRRVRSIKVTPQSSQSLSSIGR